jgi:anti-sigma B factor antagonist
VEADRKLMDAAARPVHQDTIGESMKKSMTTKKSGQLKLLKLPDALKELLMVTKFLSVFQVYDDEEEAIASFI